MLSDSEESLPSHSENSRFGPAISSFSQGFMDSSLRYAPFRMT